MIDLAVVAADVLAIVRGMVDAAGERGELDAASLEQRVMRAVLGTWINHCRSRRGAPSILSMNTINGVVFGFQAAPVTMAPSKPDRELRP